MTEKQDRIAGRPIETEIFHRLAAMADRGEPGVLATVIATERSTPRHEGSRMIIMPGGGTFGSIGGGSAEAAVLAAAEEILDGGDCRRLQLDLAGDLGVCGGRMEIFLEPIVRTDPFWVIGAGHVGRAVVEVGRTLPFRFVLVDDRPEMLAHLPAESSARTVAADPAELAGRLEIPPRGALLLASRNADLDGDYLATILAAERRTGREFLFLGGIASRTKAALIRRRLAEEGASADRLARLQLPVGIAVGAESPAEIAVSILAEALAALRGVEPLPGPDGRPAGLPFQRARNRP